MILVLKKSKFEEILRFIEQQGRKNDFGIGGGGQKNFCEASPRKFFFHTFFSKG